MSKIDELSIGAISSAEKRAGVSITSLDDPSQPKAGILAALAYEVARKDDSKLQYKDFSDKTLAEVTEILGLGDDENPTP